MPLILGVLVLVLVVAVLALSFKILGSSDDDASQDIASGSPTASSGDVEGPASTTTSTSPPASSAPTTALPSSAPGTVASTSPPTSPPRTTAPPVALVEELVGALDGYVGALDAGDIDGAYSFIAPELRAQEGWDLATFTEFWTNDVIGASVIDVGDVSASSGRVDATIDYLLPDGATSREDVALVFAPVGDAGLLALVDYEVVDTERID